MNNSDKPESHADVLLVSDRTGRLSILDVQPGETMFAAARRVMRGWDVPADAPADRTYYQNAGLYEVPRRMLPKDVEHLMLQTGDVRSVVSARKLRIIENDYRTYNLTECVHPAEPRCAAGGADGGAHDWTSDANIDGGADGGLKRSHCRRTSCYVARSAADRMDRQDAYESDVPFVSYGVLDARGREAHDVAYGGLVPTHDTSGANNDSKVNDINFGRTSNAGESS
ncbi:MAG: hypothetical protein J4F28_02250 [Nitrosopumilaceae archaeon]|nr:hypothetical protein [Nitrosopumilaceae archaeon]